MNKKVKFLLRLAVAFAFIYAGISGFLNPDIWIGYFPVWVKGYVSDQILLNVWSVFELVIGFWILFAKKIFWPSLIASAALLGVVVFNWNQASVVFRDISILLTALALAVSEKWG